MSRKGSSGMAARSGSDRASLSETKITDAMKEYYSGTWVGAVRSRDDAEVLAGTGEWASKEKFVESNFDDYKKTSDYYKNYIETSDNPESARQMYGGNVMSDAEIKSYLGKRYDEAKEFSERRTVNNVARRMGYNTNYSSPYSVLEGQMGASALKQLRSAVVSGAKDAVKNKGYRKSKSKK